MQKTEVTVKVLNSLDETKKILIQKGFVLVEEWTLNDYYFSKFSKKQLKNMKFIEIMDNSILLRQCIGKNSEQIIVYKKKEIDRHENVIGEEKICIKIDNIEKAREIFRLAGLNEWCHIVDRNYAYKNNAFEIDLQVVEGLGVFIEFEEDESMKGLDKFEKIEKMKSLLYTLGLKLGDDFSCKKVLLKFEKEN